MNQGSRNLTKRQVLIYFQLFKMDKLDLKN
jgi:hypothetical protein